jgi:hypothetical protein
MVMEGANIYIPGIYVYYNTHVQYSDVRMWYPGSIITRGVWGEI